MRPKQRNRQRIGAAGRWCLVFLLPGVTLPAVSCNEKGVNQIALEATAEAAGLFLTGLIDAAVQDALDD